ncbi:dimethylarginine dimethylaminohydrolase family protein [uncultured Microscilla sp.]|uniref:dimethylarginine dimethylaminohydrolase family protein n=1 Tax=uncultured Microscilla sp. TaxID=432653 RepID=UPI00261CD0F3|nr:arginine deiminase family protein [uncultured Microscilla sp.]
MKVNINSETGKLNTVILGIAYDRGDISYLNNPKHAEIAQKGEEPSEDVLIKEVEHFRNILEQNGVKVLRPENIANQDQIFCRDIGFGVDHNFFLANMRKANRQPEVNAIQSITSGLSQVHTPPQGAVIEGGDVVVWKDHVFVGLGERTNQQGVDFLKSVLKNKKEVVTLPLNVTNEGATNILHLDCAFQPVGTHHALIYKGGFQQIPNAIYDIFGEDNLIEVSQAEMYHMFPNVFSIHPELVVIEQSFERLSKELAKRNIQTIKTQYSNVSKLGGLLRCSACPIDRDDIS